MGYKYFASAALCQRTLATDKLLCHRHRWAALAGQLRK